MTPLTKVDHLQAWAYDSALYCEDCAGDIVAALKCEGVKPPNPPDTNVWPVAAPFGEESDTPEHCDNHEGCINAIKLPSGRKIGALLDMDLTSDGVEYLIEHISKTDAGEVADLWKREFSDYLDDDGKE